MSASTLVQPASAPASAAPATTAQPSSTPENRTSGTDAQQANPPVSKSSIPLEKRKGGDVTHCLELKSNQEIAACADKHR
jgi:hypothetical protein